MVWGVCAEGGMVWGEWWIHMHINTDLVMDTLVSQFSYSSHIGGIGR